MNIQQTSVVETYSWFSFTPWTSSIYQLKHNTYQIRRCGDHPECSHYGTWDRLWIGLLRMDWTGAIRCEAAKPPGINGKDGTWRDKGWEQIGSGFVMGF